MIKNLMTWVPAQKRWIKKYQGTIYSVSCRQLQTPTTKEQSIHAANSWWERKQAELELTEKADRHPRSNEIVEAMQRNSATPITTTEEVMGALVQLIEGAKDGNHLPEWFSQAVLGQSRIDQLQEGYNRLISPKTAKADTLTIKHQVEKWLSFLRGQVDLNHIDAGRYGSYAWTSPRKVDSGLTVIGVVRRPPG